MFTARCCVFHRQPTNHPQDIHRLVHTRAQAVNLCVSWRDRSAGEIEWRKGSAHRRRPITSDSTPTPICFANHLSPDRRGRGSAGRKAWSPFLAPTKVGERWRAKRDGMGGFGLSQGPIPRSGLAFRRRSCGQQKYCPPLAVMVDPVMKPASSEARKTTQRAISAASPSRPAGICAMMDSRTFSGTAMTMSVAM